MGKRLGYFLIAVVLLIEIPRFFGAYSGIDPDLLGLPLTALATGVVLPLGSMYIFHTWWESTRKNHGWLLAWFAANLILSAATLVPWGMAQLRGLELSQVVPGPLGWLWIGVVVVSPFVLMGGITTAMAFQRGETRRDAPKTGRDVPGAVRDVPALDGTKVRILEAFRDDGGMTYGQVGTLLGLSRSSVGRHTKELEQAGMLLRTPDGVKVKGNGHA